MSDRNVDQSYLTDKDELVFLLEEIPRKLRRLFDSSAERFGLTRTPMARTCLYLPDPWANPD
jgi:MarR family transcriptional regulator, transcriptional regulator for hemolysin